MHKQFHIAIYSNKTFDIWIGVIIFCIWGYYGGDYYHYWSEVETLQPYSDTHLESFYTWLIYFIHNNYTLFRILVWGFAVLFLILAFKKLHVLNRLSVYFFILFGLLYYAYPRVSLGISLFMWGYSFIVLPVSTNNLFKCLSYLFGAILIFLSYFTHKSVIVLIVIAILTLFKLTRSRIILACILFPFIVYYINNHILVHYIFGTEEEAIGKGYLLQESTDRGIGKMIQIFLLYTALYIFLIFLIFNLSIKNKINQFSNHIKKIYALMWWIFYVSSILFFLIIGSNAIYYRILYMIFIPMSIVATEYFKKYPIKRYMFFPILIAYLGANYWILYTFYICITFRYIP
jgi:hypothetical protein